MKGPEEKGGTRLQHPEWILLGFPLTRLYPRDPLFAEVEIMLDDMFQLVWSNDQRADISRHLLFSETMPTHLTWHLRGRYWFLRSQLLYLRGRWAEALDALDQCRKAAGHQGELFHLHIARWQGLCLAQMHRFKTAIPHYSGSSFA